VTAPEQPRPQQPDSAARRTPDPLAMSPGEKVAAEWEARHDVAARGRRGAPSAVQDYLAEARTREAPRVAAPSPPSPPSPSDPRPGTGVVGALTEPPAEPRHRWWQFRRHHR
jgi:hypothetical protein